MQERVCTHSQSCWVAVAISDPGGKEGAPDLWPQHLLNKDSKVACWDRARHGTLRFQAYPRLSSVSPDTSPVCAEVQAERSESTV